MLISARRALMASSALVLMAASPAAAQSSDDGLLAELVVTAQKRAENVQDIPKPVQVVGAGELAQNNVTEIADLKKLVPSISGTGLSIRGVATSASNIGAENKVGVTLDDVPQPSRATLANNLIDIERVEVLPGPQGTLSGRNATGGLINMVTRSPSDVWTGFATALVTDDGERQFGGFVSGPINDWAAFSLSAYSRHTKGVLTNLTTGTDTYSEVNGVRGKLELTPTEDLTVTLTAFHQQRNAVEQGLGALILGYSSVPTTQIFTPYDFNFPKRPYSELRPAPTTFDLDGFVSPRDSKSRTMDDGGVLRIDYDLDAVTLTSITSFLRETNPATTDLTASTLVNMAMRPDFDGFAHIYNKTRYVTQEVRLTSSGDGPLQYVAGAFYSNTENTYDYTRFLLPVDWHRVFGQEAFAVFGHASYNVTDKLTVMGGLRYEKDKVDYTWVFNPIGATSRRLENGITIPFPKINDLIVSQGDDSGDYVNYDASVQYHLTDNVMAYVTYGKASQGPVYDAEDNTAAMAGTLKTLEPEKVKAVEAGLKTEWFDRRMTLNVNYFDSRYENYQLQTILYDATQANTIPVLKLASVGEVRTHGVELSAAAVVTDDFRLNAAVSYTDAKIESFPYAPCYTGQTAAQGCETIVVPGETIARPVQRDLAGRQLASAPEWRGTFSGAYTFREVLGDYDIVLNGTVRAQSKSNTDLLGDPAKNLAATTFVDLGVSFTNGTYKLDLLANNVFEESAETYGTTLGIFLPPAGTVVRTRTGVSRDNTRYFGVRFTANY